MYVSVNQRSNINPQALLGVGLKKKKKKNLLKSSIRTRGQANMHPCPFSVPRPTPVAKPTAGTHQGRVKPQQFTPRKPNTGPVRSPALTVLERGPLGPRGGKKQSTALPRGQPGSHTPQPAPGGGTAPADPRRLPPPAPRPRPTHPKMTAFHTMMLFSEGAPLTPAGGSSCSLRGTGRAEAPAHRRPPRGRRPPLRKQRNPGR